MRRHKLYRLSVMLRLILSPVACSLPNSVTSRGLVLQCHPKHK